MKKIIFIILLSCCNYLAAQAPNDCVNAITICGNGVFSSNASGVGVQEIVPLQCGGTEHNSIWLKVNIAQNGTLGFNIKPVDPAIAVDYDFWVYGPNPNCTSLASPIRCATTNPNLAGLTSNHTGMNNSTISTTAGPAANGNGYVKWLDVLVGQSYYIAIDRPVGDGGFELEWIGSATLNNGAFPNPPTANDIIDYKTCSTNPNTGLFDLNSIKPLINSNTTGNTITYYSTLNNAVDGISPLFNIMANSSNPQRIYARVTDNLTKCFTLTDFELKVYPIPQATISASAPQVCLGTSVDIIIDGTPESTVEYRIGTGPVQSVILDAFGKHTFTETFTGNTTYSLVAAKIIGPGNTTACSQVLTDDVTVQVIDIVAPTISTNSPICEGDVATVLFSGTANAVIDFTIGTGATQSITINSGGTYSLNVPGLTVDTVITLQHILTTTTQVCSLPLTISETIIVKQAPVFVVPPIFYECSSTPISASFNLASKSLAIADNNSTYIVSYYLSQPLAKLGNPVDALLSPYNSTSGNQTVFVRIESPNGCVSYTVLNLVVTGAPIANLPDPLQSCGTGGIGTFDLTQAIGQIVSGNTQPTIISFHHTSQNAIDQVDGIADILSFDSASTTVYVRVTSSSCYATTPLGLIVNDTPSIRAIVPYIVCDTNFDGYARFNLPTLNNFVLNTLSASDYTISYYTDANDAATPTNAIPTAANFENTIINGQTIWVRLENNLTGCHDVVSFQIVVGKTLLLAANYTAVECDTNGDGMATFNLLDNNNAILSNAVHAADYRVEFFPTSLDATNGTSIITSPQSYNANVSPVSVLGIRVTHISSGCQSFSQLELRVNAMPDPNQIFGPIVLCDNNNPGNLKEVFNLTQFETTIRNGDSNLVFSYHATRNLALSGTNALATPHAFESVSTTVFIRVSKMQNGVTCVVVFPLQLVVNPLPIIVANPYEICDSTASGFVAFDLIGYIPTLLGPTQNPINFTITFFTDPTQINQITTNPYTNTTANLQTIYVQVTNNITGCSASSALNLIVNAGTRVKKPDAITLCDNLDDNDGVATFDLTSTEIEVLDGQIASDFLITYHLTPAQATNGTSAIVDPQNYRNTSSPYAQTIYIRVKSLLAAASCIATTSVDLIVEPPIKPVISSGIDGNNTICVEYSTGNLVRGLTLSSNFSGNDYTYQWFLNGTAIPGATNSTHPIATASPGRYTLEVVKVIPSSCSPEPSDAFEVIQSGAAQLVSVFTSSAFIKNQKITVVVEGFGVYWFQLGNGPILDNNGVFEHVSAGLHTVYIYDRKTENPSCDPIKVENIMIVDYPKFFTPNGDGFNDVWNIGTLKNQTQSFIDIFDRYGKLVVRIKPSEVGWDGTFNGSALVSTDYWFVVFYEENGVSKEYRGHFSLKR